MLPARADVKGTHFQYRAIKKKSVGGSMTEGLKPKIQGRLQRKSLTLTGYFLNLVSI